MKAKWAVAVAVAVALSPAVTRAASIIWCEAELFDDLGGWTSDTQFVDQMGSPYLLAIGLDGPVKDAVTAAEIPGAGKYRLWVRCRDWVPELSPGRFQAVLGGTAVGHVFGQSKAKGWVWEDGGLHQLGPGRLEIRLHDLTGHYGRCDAIVLADDLSFRPPDDRTKLAAARQQWGGIAREEKRLPKYDTVVVGGGLAGCFAAVASARMGCRTALIQERPVLGGNTSSEILVAPQGDTTREPLDPGEGGIVEEVRGPTEGYSDRLLRLCRSEPNLDLYLGTHAAGVEMKSPRLIETVKALSFPGKQRLVFPGSVFIDCTGDGQIGVWAGAEYRHGREPRSMYNESRAPEQADSRTMGGTLRYAPEERSGPVPFQAPPWARKFLTCSDFQKGRHPQLGFGGWQWVIEYGGMLNTYDDAEEIRDELLRIIWGMWDHVKNYCPKLKDEARNYKLAWVSHVVGKRESRRLIGDYVLTENDIANRVLFADRVSYAGWGIDIHPPGGFYDAEPPATFSHKLKFSVPLRCLYSKDIDNLMMAGRCISVSHVALGATRVMITCGLQGQAAGTAAGFCKAYETTPRGAGQNYIADLQQQLLKDGCYLIDLPNQDPRDLARGAKATASSVSPPVALASRGTSSVHPLNSARAVMFRFAGGRIGKIAVFLDSDSAAPTEVKLGLREAAALGDFSSTRDLATAAATVPASGASWVVFELGAELKPGFYYAWLPKTPGLSWSLFDAPPADTARAYQAGSKWKEMSGCYKFKLDPTAAELESDAARPPQAKPRETMFSPENVIDGFARAVRGWPHSWRPEPGRPLPQWVELDFGKPVALSCVHVSFQSQQMRADAFRIEVPDGGNWRTVAEVADNPDRRRVIRFDRVLASKLRLLITKAQSDMGVCEIRVYDQAR